MLLEALHCYSILAYVVRKGGLLTKTQNIVVGWFGSAAIVLIVCSKCFEDYGGSYHCWLQLDTLLAYGQLLPIVFLWFATFTLIEAAGQASGFRKLPGIIEEEYVSGENFYDYEYWRYLFHILNLYDFMNVYLFFI